MMFAPLEGWRQMKVTNRRTAVDFATSLYEASCQEDGIAGLA
jgi:hypothetical protein